jgi:DNA-binding NarL/FixJ family response regulator
MSHSCRVKTVIVDDHPAFRHGLRQIISTEPLFEVVAEASDGEGGLDAARMSGAEVIILDVSLPGLSGLEVVRQLRASRSNIKIVILTMHNEEEIFNAAMNLEVKGYVLKENAVVEILSCLRSVAAGNYYLTPSMSACLLKRRCRAQALETSRPGLTNLTTGERRILGRIADNRTSKQIAHEFGISHRTVEAHRNNICSKLELRGSHRLLQFALQHRAEL